MNMKRLLLGTLLALWGFSSAFAWGGSVPVKVYEGETGMATLPECTEVLMAATDVQGNFGKTIKWIFEKTQDGEIVGTLFDRTYMVKVTITYDTEKYQITYKDSSNLKYNGRTIHPSYDRWVTMLKMNIDKTITMKRATAANK